MNNNNILTINILNNNIDSGANYLGSDNSSAISPVALGKLLNFPVPQFPHLPIATNVCYHKY